MTFGAVVAAVGVGVSAASAAGAFNGKVDKRRTTPEELSAQEANRSVYDQGKAWQTQLDPVYQSRLEAMQQQQDAYAQSAESALQRYEASQARLEPYNQRLGALEQETQGLLRDGSLQRGADTAVNQAWRQVPGLDQAGVAQSARTGSGSGAALSAVSRGAGMAQQTAQQANLSGRATGMDQVSDRRQALSRQYDAYGQRLAGTGQWLDRYGSALSRQGTAASGLAGQAGQMFADYGDRVNAGLGLMNAAAGQSAEAQSNRIAAQIAQNQATAQAMGQIGGALTSAGMMRMGSSGGGGARPAGQAGVPSGGSWGHGASMAGGGAYRPGR